MRRLTLEKLAVVIEADIGSLRTDLKKARSEIASLSNNTTASAKKIKSDFADAGSKITASFKKIATAAAAAFSTKAIVDFGRQCVNAASDLQEVQNVVDTVFGSMSSEISAWAQNAKTQFGLGELSAKRYSSTMGAMLSSIGLASGEMKTMSLNLTALAADMASFYNLSSEVAFDKIRSGISGETEPLKQLGINMSVANLEAYALAQGITKSYQAMTQSEQAILRYNYLMNATKNAQGDFARTSDSWANQVRVLSETLTQLKSNIGALLIQALTPFLQMLNRLAEKLLAVSNGIKSMFGIEQETSGGLSGAADSAGDVSDNLEDANKQAEKLKNTIGGFDELHIISPETDADASDAGSGGMQIENPYEGAFDGVAEQIEGLDEATQKMLDNVISKLKPIADAVKLVKDTWATAWNSGNGEQVISNFKGYLNSLLDTIHNIGVAFQEAWNSDNTGVDFVSTIQQGLVNVIGLAQSVQQSIADAFASNSGVEFIQSLINSFGMLVDIVSAFAEGLRAAWDNNDAGTELIQGMMDGFSAVYELITSIGEAIAEAFRSEHGQAMFSSLIALGETLFGIVESITDAFRAAWEEGDLGQSILNNIADILTNLIEGARQLGENFRAAWESNELGQQIFKVLLETLNGVLEKVKEMSEAFREWASGVDFKPLLESVLTLAEAFDTLVGVIMDKLAEAFGTVLLPLAEWSIEAGLPALINALASALETVASVIEKIPPETLMKIAAGFLGIKVAISGFSAALGMLSGLANVVQTIQTLATAFSLIPSGVLPATLAIAGFAAAAAAIAINWDSIVSGAQSAATAVAGAFDGIKDRIQSAFSGLQSSETFSGMAQAAITAKDQVVSTFSTIGSELQPSLAAAKGALDQTFSGIGAGMTESLANLQQGIMGMMTNMLPGIQSAASAIQTGLGGAFNSIASLAQGAISAAVSAFQAAAPGISSFASSLVRGLTSAFQGVAQMASGAAQGISAAFAGIGPAVGTIFSGVVGTISPIFSTLSSMASTAVQTIASTFSGLGSMVGTALNGILQAASPIVSGLGDMFSGAGNVIGAIFERVGEEVGAVFASLSEKISPALAKLSSVAESVGSKIESAFSKTAQSVGDAFSKVVDTITGWLENLFSSVTSITSKIGEAFSAIGDALDNLANAIRSTDSDAKKLESTADSVSRSSSKVSAASASVSSASSASSASTMSLAAPSLPELAGGGILRKATAVVAGEYPGAATNPEIVAPQKLLQQIIAKSNETMAADIVSGLAGVLTQQQEQGAQELKTKLSGDDLLFVVEKAKKRRGATLSNNFAFGGIG